MEVTVSIYVQYVKMIDTISFLLYIRLTSLEPGHFMIFTDLVLFFRAAIHISRKLKTKIIQEQVPEAPSSSYYCAFQ